MIYISAYCDSFRRYSVPGMNGLGSFAGLVTASSSSRIVIVRYTSRKLWLSTAVSVGERSLS